MTDEIANIRSMTKMQVITWHYVMDIHHSSNLWWSVNYNKMGLKV